MITTFVAADVPRGSRELKRLPAFALFRLLSIHSAIKPRLLLHPWYCDAIGGSEPGNLPVENRRKVIIGSTLRLDRPINWCSRAELGRLERTNVIEQLSHSDANFGVREIEKSESWNGVAGQSRKLLSESGAPKEPKFGAYSSDG